MTINLSKGQTINLSKTPIGDVLHTVRMGLGWDVKTITTKTFFGRVKTRHKDIDLDASALLIGGGRVREIVYFGSLTSVDGSVLHTGDNLTGAGEGDDESIIVQLDRLAGDVDHVVFTVNSFTGETFSEIEGAYVRVVNADGGEGELARYELTGSGSHTALVMARMSRTPAGWTFTAIGQPGAARTASELEPLVLSLL